MNTQTDHLFEAAKKAHSKSYSPYSHFKVGAAILDENNQIHMGCNVENAAYPIGCCAEQSAVAQMIVAGGHQIKEILVLGKKGQACPPCGACRQIIFEHGSSDTLVHLEVSMGQFTTKKISDLLPDAFDHSHLVK